MKELYYQHSQLEPEYVTKKLKNFLNEDKTGQDLTTHYSLLGKNKIVKAHIVCEEPIIFVGTAIISNLFNNDKIKFLKKEGAACKNGEIIAIIEAQAEILLSKERVLLNLLQRLSGIATLTNKYIQTLNQTSIKILDTRKTTPGIRLFEKYAVNIGGGHNHRLDLEEGVMFKDNHLTIIRNLNESIKLFKADYPDKKIQIEVDTPNQLRGILKDIERPIDAVLLDNMSSDEVIECSVILRNSLANCFIEVSGGITLANILNYRNLDIDGMSIGAITHQAVSKNIKLEFQ